MGLARMRVVGLAVGVAAALLPMGAAVGEAGVALPVFTETFVIPSGLAGGAGRRESA